MKTRKTIAVLIAIVSLICGCEKKMQSEKIKTRFSLVHQRYDIYGKPCQTIRFNKVRKENERDIAMKEIADQWNRNLHMMRPLIDICSQDLSCYSAEYVETAHDFAQR